MVKKLKFITLVEIIVLIIAICITSLVVGKYFFKTAKEKYLQIKEEQRINQVEKIRQSFKCSKGTTTKKIDGGKVCLTKHENTIYQKIFETYPYNSKGKEQLYKLISEGELDKADNILNNTIPLDRYENFDISQGITWDENPYNERYWRFLLFGFRPFKNLFYAFDKNNDIKYLEKARDITVSFIVKGIEKPHAWDDYHAVSYRSMFLVKLWWQLRTNNLLTNDISETLLKTIERHGEFLANPDHYDKGYNHGLNEAAALYLISANFPNFNKSSEWLSLSKSRLNDGLATIVDKDGVLIENSPYYHFYTLEKFWEIYKYSKTFNKPISKIFDQKLIKMISYAEYILQPNGKIPLLGASLGRYISNWNLYKEMAQSFPEFQYVLTRGKKGSVPEKRNIVYPESGEVIMRSGWGKDNDFINQTQLIMDAGAYRTLHSDLDALSFSLFGYGQSLMPDSGLYTYDANMFKQYFHGTSSHNTVTVDNQDQDKGIVKMGDFVETKDYSMQSAEHELYKGVSHKRNIILFNKKYVLIIDQLNSDKSHFYKQNFHLFSGASMNVKGINIQVLNNTNNKKTEVMNIFQLIPEALTLNSHIGETNPPNGICSLEYNKYIPCYALEYAQKGKNVKFITLLEIGKHDERLSYSYHDNSVVFADSTKQYHIDISETKSSPEKITVNKNAIPQYQKELSIFDKNPSAWTVNKKYKTLNLIANGSDYLKFNSTLNGDDISFTLPVTLNLTDKNLRLKIKVNNVKNLDKIDFSLSSNSWQNYSTIDLRKSIKEEYDGEWLDISLSKGFNRKFGGQWKTLGSNFGWGKIDALKILLSSDKGNIGSIQISDISMTSGQKEGEVIIIFDDGYESIIPAVKYMDVYGFKGNIAVIADRVANNTRGYLSVQQLEQMKNVYGWNLINHSQRHLNALQNYFSTNKLNELETDILNGAKFLNNNDLNTTPNWYIYPNGVTNEEIKKVVGKYYLFARTTINQPESFPFGDPLGVKVISADGSASLGNKIFTSEADLENAVVDAKIYKYPLFITFHRIHSKSNDKAGYDIDEFKKLIDFINKQQIKVKTLNQFDKDNGIQQRTITFTDSIPSQLKVYVKIKQLPISAKLYNILSAQYSNISIHIKQIFRNVK